MPHRAVLPLGYDYNIADIKTRNSAGIYVLERSFADQIYRTRGNNVLHISPGCRYANAPSFKGRNQIHFLQGLPSRLVIRQEFPN
jgi:hypothetical protein